jgi:phosphate ABC transporter phosphate-binding protein
MGLGMSRASIIRTTVLVLVVVGTILVAGIYFASAFFYRDPEASVPRLKTGGTASAFFMLDGWKKPYREAKGVEVDYDNTGSTRGVTGMIEKTYAVGFTHAPMTEEQTKQAREKGGEVLHLPVVICAVVPVYNVKALADDKPLQFDGDVLAKIFLGQIDRWNNDAIKKLNPNVADKLPDEKIEVIHRKDSSGTTYIFANYLYGASDLWKETMKEPKSEIEWKVGTGAERNHGVAAKVAETEGAIGYVELLHVHKDGGDLQYGAVQNQEKTAYIHAGPDNMTAAAESLGDNLGDELTFDLTNRPGKNSYPICGTIWAVCYRNQPAAEQTKVVDFLRWVTHDGQALAAKRTYAPLPDEVARRVDEKLKSIKGAS